MLKYSGAIGSSIDGMKRCIRVTYTYISKVDSPPTIIILAVAAAQRVTYACTHVCYLGGFISALACGIFPRDERTMSVAKRKTRATLGRKYMGKPTGMRFRGETTRKEGDPTDEPASVMQSAFLLTEVATMLGLHASPGVNVGLHDSPR
ncbi:hypothetical protein ALC57_00636 [Trachymyrmex cornetzi]|uniref:Uncharacterized protein n=1 Tax=Trachymyrmex cornetzi TaxID=471704 RepID=A0A151JRX2_9HYME|nr:hypothetical protein ALC57_00636 [Trachymyrmex cornetzi]